VSSSDQQEDKSPPNISPLESFTLLQQSIPQPQPEDDICSVAGSETSLDLDSDSSDDSQDDSEDSSDDDSSDEEETAGSVVSYLQRISQYEKEGPTMANRGDSCKKMI
jgi:hypothetical protein